jgi:hypothetical protein
MPNTRRFLSAASAASLQNTAGDIAPKSMRATSRAGSQSEALLIRTFEIDKGGQLGSYCLSLTTSNLF